MKMVKKKKLKKLNATSTKSVAYGAVSMLCFLFILFIFIQPNQGQSKPLDNELEATVHSESILIDTPSRAVARGEKLNDVPITKIKWPKSKINSLYIAHLTDYKGAIALTPLPPLLPIPIDSVTLGHVEQNVVVEGIPEGMRAITVKVDAESSVEGWAQSGNYVDVILIKAAKDAHVGLQSVVIAENIKILSAGQLAQPVNSSSSAPKAPNTVTLLVNQEAALKIKTASSIGKLTFALRGQGDSSPALATSMTSKQLIGGGSISKQPPIKGFAKGPDGKTYILEESASRWVTSGQAPLEVATNTNNEGQ